MQWQNNGETWTEQWRKECEARELLSWPLAARRKQLDLVQQKRGWIARLDLQDEMERLWKLQKTMQSKQEIGSMKKVEQSQKQQQIDLI